MPTNTGTRPTKGVAALGIADYDTSTVATIVPQLPHLSSDQLQAVREHELAGKNRAGVLNRVDALLGTFDAEEVASVPAQRDDADDYWERYRRTEAEAASKPGPAPLPEPSYFTETPTRKTALPLRGLLVSLLVLAVVVTVIFALAKNVDRFDDLVETNDNNGTKEKVTDVLTGGELRAEVTDWRDDGGQAHISALSRDVTKLSGAGSLTASERETACNRLKNDTQDASSFKAVPDATAQSSWSTALGHFKSSAKLCLNGLGDNDDAVLRRSTAELTQGGRALDVVVTRIARIVA